MKWPPIIEDVHLPWWLKLRDVLLTLVAWFLLCYLLRDMLAMSAYWLLRLLGVENLVALWPPGKLARDIIPFLKIAAVLVAWLTGFAIVRWRLLTNTRDATSQPGPLDRSDQDRVFGVTADTRQALDTACVITVHLRDDGAVAGIEPVMNRRR